VATQEKNRTAGAKTDIVVYASPEQYASFPAVFRTDSELVLAFMVQDLAPLRAAGRHPHYQDASASKWAVSHDHGFNWESCDQPLRVGRILDVACASPQMRHRGVVKHYAGAPLRDGGLVTLTGGRERPGYSFLEHRSIGVASVEGGRTPGLLRTYEVNGFGPFDNLACYSVVRTSDGALLAAGYAVYNPAGSARQKETVVFLQSADEGRSWGYLSHIAGSVPQLP